MKRGAHEEKDQALPAIFRPIDRLGQEWIKIRTQKLARQRPRITAAPEPVGRHACEVDALEQAAVELAERYIREVLVVTPDWPDLSGQGATMVTSLDLLALVDAMSGHAQRALDRYADANLDVNNRTWRNFDHRALRPAVLHAVLYRHAGQPERADRLLRELLDRIADEPIVGMGGKGFTDFTIYAFLGETDNAVEALKAASDAGWLPESWGLDHGAFDAQYAAVLADPRIQRLRSDIESRVTAMRESYLTDPDLPEELLLESGLATR